MNGACLPPTEEHNISFIKPACFQTVLTTCYTRQDMYPRGRISCPAGRQDVARYQNYSAKNKTSGDSPRSITTNEIN